MARMAILFLLAILLINISSVSAENNEEIIYGLKAGINFSTLNGENSSLIVGGNRLSPTSKISAVAGGFILYKLWPEFGIQPELLFSMKGVDFDAEEYLHTWSIWYIELPVLFKTMYEMENNVSGSFYAGPAVAYKIKSTWSEKIRDDYTNEDEEMQGIKDYDFSAVIGGSMDMELLGGRMGIDLRYTYGLVSIQETANAQNGTISIALFYMFDLGKRKNW
ncbi:porin family protein [Bacteroidota bacterium]